MTAYHTPCNPITCPLYICGASCGIEKRCDKLDAYRDLKAKMMEDKTKRHLFAEHKTSVIAKAVRHRDKI